VAKKSPFAMQTIADVLNLEDLAGMLGVEHVRIGHGKDLGALKNELRWNDRPAR
jgi:L-arabinose isomerase